MEVGTPRGFLSQALPLKGFTERGGGRESKGLSTSSLAFSKASGKGGDRLKIQEGLPNPRPCLSKASGTAGGVESPRGFLLQALPFKGLREGRGR